MSWQAYDQIEGERFMEGEVSEATLKPDRPYVYVFEALGRYFARGEVQYLYRVGTTKRLVGFMSKFKALNRPRRFALLKPDGGESEKRSAIGWPNLSDYVCDRLKSRTDFEYVVQFGLKWFTTTHKGTTVDAILHEIWETRSMPKDAHVRTM